MWAAAFVFTSTVGFVGIAVLKNVADFWTGWVLQLAAIFFVVAFTEFYPGHAAARASVAAGETPDEPAPSVIKPVLAAELVLIAGIVGSALRNKLSPAAGSNV